MNKIFLKKLLSSFIIFLVSLPLLFSAVMAKPRHVYLLKTEHFDILFSKPSEKTASLLAGNADALYEKAKRELGVTCDLHMPVVISPDSDRLSVDYTFSPYNRIVIFDGVPESKDTNFQNALLGLFYHEIYLALSQSIMDPINQKIYDTIGGDAYQPISLFYLPFSFVEGRAFLSEGQSLFDDDDKDSNRYDTKEYGENNNDKSMAWSEKFPYGRFSDQQNLEILIIAKYENKFPNYLQAFSPRSIYPGQMLNDAAGTAFAAFLMQRYGIEKYVEFWEECGKVNFLLTSSLFYKVYGLYLNQLWDEFEQSIPLPFDIEKVREKENVIKSIFLNEEGVSSSLLVSTYGLIWYDDTRHEVNILDLNSPIVMRNLLFLASGVKKLTLSPDGRYLVVSFSGIKTAEMFRNDKVWIYDLKKREFKKAKFLLRDGVILDTGNDKNSIMAGIYVKDKKSVLQFHSFNYTDGETSLIMEKSFLDNQYPSSLTALNNKTVAYILSENNEKKLCIYNIKTNKEEKYVLNYKGKDIAIKNLRILENEKSIVKKFNGKTVCSVNFFLPSDISFSRIAFIVFNKDNKIEDVYFQSIDVPGGIRYPSLYLNNLFFVSQRYSHNKIQYMSLNQLSFEKGNAIRKENKVIEKEKKEYKNEEGPVISSLKYTDNLNLKKDNITDTLNKDIKKLGNYDVEAYNPFRYIFNMSFVPFMAIKDLATIKKQKLWPSLGGTFITEYDPFLNNRIMISGSGGYAMLDFSKIINPTKDDINDKKLKHVDDQKNISFGISIENTSTPVEIRSGVLFKFNTKGEYNFTANLNAFLQIPVGMAFSKFNFSLISNYIASTDYYDLNLKEHYPSLQGFPSFNNSYETSKLLFFAEYSNIHQSGFSKYEQSGFSLGIKLDSFWDISEIKMLNSKVDALEHILKEDLESSMFTKAQLWKFKKDRLTQISQLALGGFVAIELPKLIPVNMINGWILSLPTSINAELFNAPGTALTATAETLLFGYECQNGFPFLYLYFARLGLKFGYNINLKYDTYTIALPDIRVRDNMWNLFSNVYIKDSLYFEYDMDFGEMIGRLSECNMHLDMKAEYFLKSKGFAFSVKFRMNF